MKKIFALFCSVAWLVGGGLRAQDPIFSQFYAAPLQVNPGFAGSAFAPRIGLAYRNQWPGFNNAYRTYAIYYEQNLDRLNSGLGFALEGDNAGQGIYKTNRLSATYAYNLSITERLAVRFGVEMGAHQTALDWDKLVFPDDIDPVGGITYGSNGETRPEESVSTQLDVSSGLLLLGEKVWFGAALKHLNTPNDGFLLVKDNLSRGLPLRYTVHGGTELVLDKGNKHRAASFLSPNFMFLSQGPYKQLNVGAYANVGSIFGGLWYRHTFRNADAAIVLVGLREGVFKLGLSYDITVSGLAGRSGGTFEITMGILLDQDEGLRQKRKNARLNDCLGMFQ